MEKHPASDRDAWRAWQKHLVRRRRPKAISEVVAGRTHPLLWSIPVDVDRAAIIDVLGLATGDNGDAAGFADREWIWLQRATGPGSEFDASAALSALALVHGLPHLASVQTSDAWWDLLARLVEFSTQRQVNQLDETVDGRAAWIDQLLCGEIPFTLAYYFPELQFSHEPLKSAFDTLSDGLTGLTDGEGLIHVNHLPWLRPLLACWTRCGAMAAAAKRDAWSKAAQIQYEWFVRQAIRLSRTDGRQFFDHGAVSQWQPEQFRTSLELVGDEEDMAAAKLSLPRDLGLAEVDELPCEGAVHSEWSQLAVLRSDWKPAAPRMAVSYADGEVLLELESGRDLLLSGSWRLEIQQGGELISSSQRWDEVCWFSDDDVDYLELSAELSGSGRVERQILLAREDRFLYLCDNLVDIPGGPTECVMSLTLADDVYFAPEPETREAEIGVEKPRAVVMPLALPEWKCDTRLGEFTQTKRALTLLQRTGAGNLACPLFFDLVPRRFRKKRTWRQLTVAESLEICPRDAAVAYRVQSGMDQWIFYRSLTEPMNRTFIGQNVASEFFAGRLHRDGDVDELLEIEGPAA